MKMRIEPNAVHVTLSRLNLQTLLAKLDVPGSLRTLCLRDGDAGCFARALYVTAEDDEPHYKGREPGHVLNAPAPGRLP